MTRSIPALAVAIALTTGLATAAAPAIIPARPAKAPAASPSPSARAASPSASPAASPSPGGGANFSVGVWTVHADSLDANFKTGDFSTPTKVFMTRTGGDITADRANGNYKKQLVYLNGHVVMHDTSGNYGGLAPGAQPAHGGPSTLTADKAQVDGNAKIYKAIGNVHYVQADTTVDADNGTLNDVTHDLFLQGNVHIVQGTHKLDAESVLYNTVSGSAHAQGDVTIQFPGQLKRGLATPKPLHVPKNPVTEPAGAPTPTKSP